MLLMASAPIQAADNKAKEAKTIRKERNLIREGNKLYNYKRFAEAEVKYRQALGANPDSEIGLYNLAASLIKQAGKEDKLENRNSPIFKADSILNNLVAISKDPKLTSRAFYNLGNIAFNEEKYDRSVAMYKDALRRNPDDDQARENLRLAQKKLQQQQQQDQDKDKDKKDDKQNQDQDQKQDKQDQNKDKQDQNKQPQNSPQQDQKENKDKQNEQGGAAPNNDEQILNAVQNNEKTTQQKVNALRANEQEHQRRSTKNQW